MFIVSLKCCFVASVAGRVRVTNRKYLVKEYVVVQEDMGTGNRVLSSANRV
jgi:hypothetical protein